MVDTPPKLTFGYLKIWIGPMASGKTTKALNEAMVKSITHSTLYISYEGSSKRDVAGGDEANFSSHNALLKSSPTNITFVSTVLLSEVDVRNYDVIVIDEANFYKDLYFLVKHWLKLNKYIIVVGLDGDYKQEKFGHILDLIPLCDKIKKTRAVCGMCAIEVNQSANFMGFRGVPAPFTKRNIQCDQVELIGGNDIYTSVCRRHL